jgi:hypothetical protein
VAKPFLIMGLRGRNGSDAPIALPDDQCCEAVNVDFSEGGLVRRRGGCTALGVTFSSGGPFASAIASLVRHVPGVDETAMELWAMDGSGQFCRLAAATTWTEPTLADAMLNPSIESWNVIGASVGGFLFLAYRTAVNRLHLWDGSTVRRAGFATPGVPTLATLGGAGLTITRYYRVRWVHISGSDTVRRSEAGTSASLSITDDSGIRVTRPTAAGEGETHWEVEYSDDNVTFYRASQVAIATTTYDDTAATIDDTLTLSPEAGINMPQPSFRYVVKAGARLLQAGCHETVAGSSFIPLNNEVYWTPIIGANDVGDVERQPISYRVSLDHPVTGLSEALNGTHYAFGPRGFSAIVPTQLTGAGAFQRITESTAIGCIRHQSIVAAEDEMGQGAVYFLSHRGPYRIGVRGLQYVGEDIGDIWATVNISANISSHGVYYADIHQIWWWVASGDSEHPDVRLVFDTRLGKSVDGDSVRGGWSTADGAEGESYASALFSTSVAATMGERLVPYTAKALAETIYRWDTGTDDAGTDFQAYIDTKEYAPAGLGQNCSLTEPHIIGEASAAALVTVSARTDFGRETSDQHLVSLAPEFSETHVQRKVDGLQLSGIGTVRFRIGDGGATDPGFGVLDAFVATYEPAEGR